MKTSYTLSPKEQQFLRTLKARGEAMVLQVNNQMAGALAMIIDREGMPHNSEINADYSLITAPEAKPNES